MHIEPYKIWCVPETDEIREFRLESRGSRYKLWIAVDNQPNPWLLKFPRAGTGEHWAEKVAAEVGAGIGVICARVELARCGDQLATICESFDPDVRWELVEIDERGFADEWYPSPGETAFSTDTVSIDDDDAIFGLAQKLWGWDSRGTIRVAKLGFGKSNTTSETS